MISQFQVLVSQFNKEIAAYSVENLDDLRVKLIDEEVRETAEAMKRMDTVEVIDGLCDVLYVTYGAADVYGVELDTRSDEEQEILKEDWIEILTSVEDFKDSANQAMAAIRTKDKLALRLLDLASGCWDCAGQGLGIDLRPFFREVHRTNMLKLSGPVREDGKKLKPPDWMPPRIEAMLNRIRAGNPAACTHADQGLSVAATPHPQGGHFCVQCGGLFVDWTGVHK